MKKIEKADTWTEEEKKLNVKMNKRLLEHPVLPYEKGQRIFEYYEADPITRWVRPSQFLAYMHGQILSDYREKKHFLYNGFCIFRNKDAQITVYTQSKNMSRDNFVFTILIKTHYETLLRWSYSYNWNGGWFETHLKLLCLLES